MTQSDLALSVFFGALMAWASKPRRQIQQNWIFPTAGGHYDKGVNIPARSPAEALERFLKECV